MEVLLELLIIEIIFLQSKFTQSYWTNVEKIKFSIFCFAQLLGVFFKSVQWPGAGWYGADCILAPVLSRHDSFFCILAPVLSGHDSFLDALASLAFKLRVSE